MKLLTYFIAALFSYATMMCSQGGDASAEYSTDKSMAEPGYSPEAVEDYHESLPPEADNQQTDVVTVDARKFIKRGFFTFPVTKLDDGEVWVRNKTKEFNGYISSQNEQNYDYRNELNMEIRIPSASFDDFTASLMGNFKRFDRKDINVQDVTEEFLDVDARIKTKKALETRYTEILKQANTVKEILEVELELANIRQQIESAEGRLKYLANQTSYSTINISMYTEQGGPQVGYGNKLGRALVNGWNGLLNVLIGLLTLWPLFLIGGLFIWGLLRWSRRGSRKVEKSPKVDEDPS